MKKQTSALSKTFDGLKQAGSMAAGMLMRDMVQGATQAMGEVIQLGGEVDTLKNSFERLVAASGDTSLTLEDLQKATQGTVADVDLLQAANQALMLGLPTENLDEMMGSAIKLGHAMGIDAKKAVESLTTGIGRQSKMILDNLGVVFDAQEAYDWYAESLGTTADQLDEAQKKEAWMAYAIEQVNQKAEELGDVTSEAQTAQERWNATLTNLKTSLGKMLGPLGAIAPALEGFMPMMGTMASTMLPNLIQGMGGFGGVVSSVTGLLPSFGS
ncbi:MAG: hypothetical protein GWN58_25385, partial [Anaerolineae bacterium]|nr:hypothetical protein [Anaerolineae bacterium]